MLSFVKVCEHNFIEGKVLRVTKLCKYPHEYLQFDSIKISYAQIWINYNDSPLFAHIIKS